MPKKVAKKTTKKSNYGAENIAVLEGLEPVRKRPGMYIGSTGPEGLQHMLKEVFDNSRDEAMGGYADEVEVVLLPGDVVRVADNGRGIPVEKHKKTKVSALETIMTTLHAGGKFDNDAYKVSGGLHGVGASVVNALSEWAHAKVFLGGDIHFQEYKRGKKKAAVKKIGKTKEQGTVTVSYTHLRAHEITFKADNEIFSETNYNWNKIITYLRQQAYLVKKLRVRAIDAREYKGKLDEDQLYMGNIEAPNYTFYFEGGLLSLIKFHNQDEKTVHKNVFYVERDTEDINVEIALQYIDDIVANETSFTNNTPTPGGGTHLSGFRTALTRTLNNYAKKNNLLKAGEDTFTGDDVREGITAVVSVKLPDPQFEGQTKDKLGSVEAKGAVESVFGEAFSAYLEEHPDDAKQIIGKVSLAVRARKAAKAAKDSILRKGALEGMTLPGKLADCQSRKAEDSEIWIVEGDSAGGSAKQGRDRRTQAILPLRGKILNVERARLDKMLASKEVKALVIALGAAIGDTFNIEKLRYHKVVIATDADVDGAHIRTLLLTLFYRYFKPLIEEGYIYIAQPPLYKIKIGKDSSYAYTEKEKNQIVGADIDIEDMIDEDGDGEEEEEVKAKVGKKVSIQRYKGLGEMNPSELWETTMNPENRVLKRVDIEDASEANKTFEILMGSEVPPRKLFIQTNAKMANIDA